MLQTETMVQHAVRRNANLAIPKLLHSLALHDISQKEIDIRLYIRLFRQHLFCQRAFPCRVRFLHHLLRIQHRRPEELLLIHLLINIHGNLRIRRFYDEKQVVIPHVPLDRILPAFVFQI